MDANALTLGADINNALQHGKWEVFVTCHMRNGFAYPTSSRWNADASELTSSWPSKYSKVKFTLTCLSSSTVHPNWCERVHLQNTGMTNPLPTQERCLLSSVHEMLEQSSSTPSLVTLSIYLQKTVGPSMVQNLSCNTCVISVPCIGNFLYTVTPEYLCFPLPPIPTSLCGYCWPSWPFLPLINKIKNKLMCLSMNKCAKLFCFWICILR